jgi:hypothetical protein
MEDGVTKLWYLSNRESGAFWIIAADDKDAAVRIRNEQGWPANRIRETAFFAGTQCPGEFRLVESLEWGERLPF